MLASPDIPVWALTNGRANPLQACLPRFQAVFLFSNEAEVVLRLLATLANFFVFPSSSREGGYRLGNVVPLEGGGSWGIRRLDLNPIGFYGMRSVGSLNKWNACLPAMPPLIRASPSGMASRLGSRANYVFMSESFSVIHSSWQSGRPRQGMAGKLLD